MKLYFSPGACSMSDHIALHEAGLSFEHVKVDLETHETEDGEDFTQINPKGYVPTLSLDDGSTLTENVAILDFIAGKAPMLMPTGDLGRTRMIEALAYIASEVHVSFHPLMTGGSDEEQAAAKEELGDRFAILSEQMGDGDYLLGSNLSAADCYLFVMTMWAEKKNVDLPGNLTAFRERMKEREAVQKALSHEGLA